MKKALVIRHSHRIKPLHIYPFWLYAEDIKNLYPYPTSKLQLLYIYFYYGSNVSFEVEEYPQEKEFVDRC